MEKNLYTIHDNMNSEHILCGVLSLSISVCLKRMFFSVLAVPQFFVFLALANLASTKIQQQQKTKAYVSFGFTLISKLSCLLKLTS